MNNEINCFACGCEISTKRTKRKKDDPSYFSPRRTAKEHHIIPKKYKKKYDNKQSVFLCQKCHYLIHKIIVTDAVKFMYKQNSNYFQDCLYKAIRMANLAEEVI